MPRRAGRTAAPAPASSLTCLRLAVAGALLAAPGAAPAFFETHRPLTAGEIARRVAMTRVARLGRADGDRKAGEVREAGPRGVRFDAGAADGFILEGADRDGAPWRVTFQRPGHGGSVWLADLDRDGTRDLAVLWSTGGGGLAPRSHLTVVLFDPAGRPVPWEAEGYFEADERGVRDPVDLDRDGRAELVWMGFDDGYWITWPYEAGAGFWRRARSPHAGRVYPLHTRFLRRPVRTPGPAAKGRSPFAPDLSNRPSGPWGTAVRLEPAGPDPWDPFTLHLADGRRCTVPGVRGTTTVVLDGPGGREAATFGARGRAVALLEQIVRRRLAVRVAGRRTRAGCTPEVVWARARRARRRRSERPLTPALASIRAAPRAPRDGVR